MGRTRLARVVPVAAAALLVAVLGAGSAASAEPQSGRHEFRPGAPGVGDPYFPLEGNGGYDARHYTLDLSYDPETNHLAGTVHMAAKATQNLSRFDLDLKGLHVRSVSVNRHEASFRRDGQELVITPREGLRSHKPFEVSVRYEGKPQASSGPIVFGGEYGWITTDDGVIVACEPNAASTWFPSNDHPTDKAAFTFRVTVPKDREVVANGSLRSRSTSGDQATYVWDETRPMATYLATMDVGNWDFQSGRTDRGVKEVVAIDPSQADNAKDVFATTGKIVDYWSEVFGRYPFKVTGAIVDTTDRVGWSLETQTRPVYSNPPSAGGMAHELAHQWYGDSVSPRSWDNIWLNEGFASFGAWLWEEHSGGRSAAESFRRAYDARPADSPFWDIVVADPGRNDMFSGPIYTRGAMTLEALRMKIGDKAFFTTMRAWARSHRYGTGTTPEFISLAEKISRRDLGPFFNEWLYQKGKPTGW